MRGKEHNNLIDRMTKGITPAYAGKSMYTSASWCKP